MRNNELKRCFIALDLPREAENEIKGIQNKIKKQNLLIGKFTEPENLHLTLKFLGEIDEEIIDKAKKRLHDIKIQEFEASLGECGIFSQKFIKIVWIKLEGKGIWELQKKIDESLKDLFAPEERFMSHITLARVKKVPDRKKLIEYIKNIKPKNLKFLVNEFFLKKSILQPEGPVYEDIERYLLK